MPDRESLLTALRDHQSKVADLLDEAQTGLKLEIGDRAAIMASIRWRLVRVLRDYQLFKHQMIFDPAIHGGDVYEATVAAAMKARCTEASESYERHVRKWSLDGVGDWQGYHTDKSMVIDGIRRHLVREAREVQTLLIRRAGVVEQVMPRSC